MRVLWRQLCRKPLITAVLALALTLAVAMSLVAVGAWEAIRQQAGAVDGNYVTIAIMKEQLTEGWDFYERLAVAAAMESSCVVQYDSRCMLGAEIADSRALTSGAVVRNDYRQAFDTPSYAMAVLAVTCEKVTTRPSLTEIVIVDNEETVRPTYEEYNVAATVNEVVSMAEGYEPPQRGDTISMDMGAYREDGTIPFEPGKTYLVFGYFGDYTITYHFYEDTDPDTGEFVWKTVEEQSTDYPYTMLIGTAWTEYVIKEHPEWEDNPYYELSKWDWLYRRQLGQREDGTYYYYPMEENTWTHFAEYTGSVSEFLASEAGRVWREETIPLCERNQRSATLMLTDDIQSIYSFNNGLAEVVEGREISAEEYVNGGDVCLVSVEYAKYNGLHLGDKLHADLHDTLVIQREVGESGALGGETEWSYTLRHGVLTPENRIGVEKDYEIVGIYSAPAFQGGLQLYTADTIYVPKRSVPNAERYEDRNCRLLQSFILRNGAEEEFFEELRHGRCDNEDYAWLFNDPNNIDFSGDFMTFNQQYDKAAGNIEVMQSNARRLLALSLLGFLIVLAAVRYFEARRQRATVVTMKKLGIARRRIVRELIGAGLLLDLAATVLGGALAWLLFGEITRRANVGTLQLPLSTLLISAAATAGLLAATSVVSAVKLSKVELMQTKK